MGGAAGAAIAHQGVNGKHRNEAAGAGIGAVGGALLCGGLAYLITEDPKPAPKPTPPPPPPPPAPKVKRTIVLHDVLFDFDRSTVKPEAAKIS